MNGLATSATVARIPSLRNVVGLDGKELAEIVVFDLAKFEEVLARIWPLFKEEINNQIAHCCFNQYGHLRIALCVPATK